MKIGIVGAGGIGSYYAGLLSRAGHDVRLIARGEHLAAINERGLTVRTPDETFVARPIAAPDGNALTDCEFVIVSVKGYSLPEVSADLAAAAHGGAAIVPLLNGVDVAERLESGGVPRRAIIGGLATVSLVRTEPGVVERRSPFDRIVVGELDGARSERAERFAEALSGAGTTVRVSDDIQLDLWRKFAFIVTMNVISGLPRQPVGPMLSFERGRELARRTIGEIVAVSRAGATALSENDEAKLRDDVLALQPSIRPSFLADLERGGPTELDLLVGAVSRMGRERGVPTPIHDVAFAAFEAATLGTGRH